MSAHDNVHRIPSVDAGSHNVHLTPVPKPSQRGAHPSQYLTRLPFRFKGSWANEYGHIQGHVYVASRT